METQALINKLVQECHAVQLSSFRPAPADVDIFVPAPHAEEARRYIKEAGFILTRDTPEQKVGRRFENGTLYILDCISDFNLYTAYLPGLKLSEKGNSAVGHAEFIHAAFKALCFNHQHKIPLLKEQENFFRAFLQEATHFEKFPVALTPFLAAPLTELFEKLASLSRFSRFWGMARVRLKALGTGSTLAFVGPDGSGKSFIIDKMKGVGPTAVLYMGDWFFRFQRFYTFLVKTVPSPWNRFLYGIYFIENLIRRGRAGWWRLMGRIVLMDRFPGTNRNLRNRGFLFRLNQVTLRVFPKPDYLVFLYAPPEVIHQRKQELSVDEIRELQERLHEILKGTRYTVLDTQKLDESLNRLLAMAYLQETAH